MSSTAGEVETIGLGFLGPITGNRGSLTVNGFNGVPIFANDYIGTETLATAETTSSERKRLTNVVQ